jgi:hypothetical protein
LIDFLKRFWRKTLNSVIFGICLMILVALYIALGSGIARVREAFEMNELQFFNAWPLKLLMLLLVVNLATVTWTRIPFTPPRYGVWTIHAGIIVLIAGMAFYYSRKVEGLTRLYADARQGPITVDHFYDAAERALYVRSGELWTICPLPNLPRFKGYESLNKPSLRDIKPALLVRDGEGDKPRERPMFKSDVKLDVTGYWPYATISTTFRPDPSNTSDVSGIRVTVNGVDGTAGEQAWLIASDRRNAISILENNELQHVILPDSQGVAALREAAGQMHRLTAKIAGHDVPVSVEVGKTYPIEGTGYTLTVESYNPAWPMSGTGEIVKALTLMIKSPTMQYRRMILDGKDLQTDFKLDDPTGGPMGKRQKEPLDKDLVLLYRFSDPFRMMPRQGSVKHMLITPRDGKGITIVTTGMSQPVSVKELPDGAGELELPHAEVNAPFLKAMGQSPADHPDHPPIKVTLQRQDHVVRDDSVEVVPPAKRDRGFGEMGVFQVLRVKVKSGDFAKELLVPYAQDAAEAQWEGDPIKLPDGSEIAMQLGNTRLQMPAKLTLNRFELIPYRGGDTGEGSTMRDFRATMTIEDPASGDKFTDVAHMNHPIYFNAPGRLPVLGNWLPFRDSWLFFQANYDPQQRWTGIGVGNRPGAWMMTAGSLMIFIGLMYAFYLKPIVIRRMKQKALEQAAKRKRPDVRTPALVDA